MTIAKMLNLGSGRTKFPGPRPDHHALVPEALYAYPEWLNISKNASEEPDCVMDLFAYPWPLESNAYEGALLAHLCEHIDHTPRIRNPIKRLKHDVVMMHSDHVLKGQYPAQVYEDDAEYQFFQKRTEELANVQDGWYAFFSELWRVLNPGAMVHIISPHAYSTGAHFDPSHTRYLLPETFDHSMKPDENAPFEYANGGLHFERRDVRPGVGPRFAHLVPTPSDSPQVAERKLAELYEAAETRINVITEFYVRLECVK